MRFFSLTHPRYATDQEFARRNPVRTAVKFRLPGVQCSSCGDLCGRVRVPCSRNDSIDESVWDGSDFCSLDRNANIIVVTQSVVDVVTRAGFSNVAAGPF